MCSYNVERTESACVVDEDTFPSFLYSMPLGSSVFDHLEARRAAVRRLGSRGHEQQTSEQQTHMPP